MKKKVLFVDDEIDLLFAYETVLNDESDSFEFIGAKNVEECIERLKNSELPDAILLDIMIPEGDGIELFKLIKENSKWKHIPIAFLTANINLDIKRSAKILADDYIEKPIENKVLLEKLRKLTSKKGIVIK